MRNLVSGLLLIVVLVLLVGVVYLVWPSQARSEQSATNPAPRADAGSTVRPSEEAQSQPSKDLRRVMEVMQAIKPLGQPLGKPREGDWLYHHKEHGQPFAVYLRSDPVVPTTRRRTIYIQPLGEFTAKQRQVVTLASQYISACYGLPVKMQKDLSLELIPASARRTHPSWGDKQILSTYVLDDVLGKRLPKDAFASIAFTPSDLWPGEGWNFVFGQASLRDRVGVWSIYRFGDPDKDKEEFRQCLRRTIATGAHELGHMFSIEHCIYYSCVMCGSNNLPEADSRPLTFCSVCMGKVLWATGMTAEDHYSKLAEFCRKQGMDDDAKAFNKALAAVRGGQGKPASKPIER